MPASAPISQAFDEPATCRTERGAHCREGATRCAGSPGRHGVPDTDSVPDEIPKSGGRGQSPRYPGSPLCCGDHFVDAEASAGREGQGWRHYTGEEGPRTG